MCLWLALVVAVGIPYPSFGALADTSQDEELIAVSETTVEGTEVDAAPEAVEAIDVEPINYDGSIACEECRKGAEHLEALAVAEAAAIEYQNQLAQLFTEEDVIMMARTIDAEAGAVYPLSRRAAVGWTILNRLDNGRWGPTTIAGIISQPGQFAYYANHGYSELNYQIALDVLTRWADEQITGEQNPGRVLDQEYEFFYGDGSQNHFYDWERHYWDYDVEYDPYGEEFENAIQAT